MARSIRIQYKNALYHIYSRGQRKENIFLDNNDREKFIKKLEETIEKFSLKIHCYVLMNNHFHLLLETPLANLSKAMHNLDTSYVNWFKAKHSIIGPIFQGRYNSTLVEKETYLMNLSAYIHLNPSRAGIVKNPVNYYWSSFQYYTGMRKIPKWLYIDEILIRFSNSKKYYTQYVLEWTQKTNKKEIEKIKQKDSILGSEAFQKKIKEKIKKEATRQITREMPEVNALIQLDTKEIKFLILKFFKVEENKLYEKTKKNNYRKLFIYGLRYYTNLSLKEIGKITDMNYTAVSELTRRFLRESAKDSNIKKMIQYLDDAAKRKIYLPKIDGA